MDGTPMTAPRPDHREECVASAAAHIQAQRGGDLEIAREIAEALVLSQAAASHVIEELDVSPAHRVLIVDSRFGSLAVAARAVVGPAGHVAVREEDPTSVQQVRSLLRAIGLDHTEVGSASEPDGSGGYDRILVSRPCGMVDPQLLESLANGGRLLCSFGGCLAINVLHARRTEEAVVEGGFVGSHDSLFPMGAPPAALAATPPAPAPALTPPQNGIGAPSLPLRRSSLDVAPADLARSADFLWHLQLRMNPSDAVWLASTDRLYALVDDASGASIQFHIDGDNVQAGHDPSVPLLRLILDNYGEWRAIGRPDPQRYIYRADATGQRVHVEDSLLHIEEMVWSSQAGIG
jgi:protein-L-isoaspartate O-methyltransferase